MVRKMNLVVNIVLFEIISITHNGCGFVQVGNLTTKL